MARPRRRARRGRRARSCAIRDAALGDRRTRSRRSGRSTSSRAARTSSRHASGLSLDVRAPDAERLDALVAAIGFEPSYRVEPAQLHGRGARRRLRDAIEARGLPVVELPSGRRTRRGNPRGGGRRRGDALRAQSQRRRQPLAGRALVRRGRRARGRRARRRARASYVSLNEMSWAPSQSIRRPSSRRFSLPETIVAKWFPASAPALLANAT